MASTALGQKVEAHINAELKRLGIKAVASVMEGPDNLDLGVHVQGAITGKHFVLENGYANGLNEGNKKTIATILNELVGTN
jgi:hypothetical protein